jgi:hypothetical protein
MNRCSLAEACELLESSTAVRNSVLITLYLFGCMNSKDYVHVIDGELFGAATRCIDAFLAAVKHNKSITKELFNLRMGMSVDELSGFILNNKALKKLYLESWEPVPLVQSTVCI